MKHNRVDTFAWGIIVALVVAAGTSACKQQKTATTSQHKTLDNFARVNGEPETLNRCGYDYDGKPLDGVLAQRAAAITAPNDALKNAAIGVLMRLPENLASPFFAAGGKIVITEMATEQCAGTLSEAERTFAGPSAKEPRACWRQPSDGEAPEIVVAASEEDVHHGLLRMFAYVFADFFVARTAASADPEVNTPTWRQAIEGFKAARSTLATTFLAELDQPATQEAFNRLEGFRAAAGERFDGFVAAEAVDSFYCSDATRQAFWKRFPKTYAAFIGTADQQALVHEFGPIPPAP
jgi:hypothetical protein